MPRRPFNDRELQLWRSLKGSLPRIASDKGHSKPCWKLKGNGSFSIGSVKRAIIEDSTNTNASAPSQALKNLWKSYVPQKCKFFTWMVIHQRLNTMDIIRRRNPNICLNPSWCIFCKSSDEDLNHLFIHFSKAQSLWNKLHLEIGLNMIISSAKDLCLCLCGIPSSNVKSTIKFNVAVATLWSIWSDGNNQIFIEKSLSLKNL